MVHYNSCPLCKSEDIGYLFSCKDHFVSKEVFRIAECKACGFVFTQDHPAVSEIGRYYESEDYISHSNTSKGISNKGYLMVRSFMLKRKLKMIRKITGMRTGTLLDIGSGSGHFCKIMKSAGWKVSGIEINSNARNYSVSQFGLDIITPEKITGLQTGSFDCITLWHVLEHFDDPWFYSSEIHRLLKPDGICIIALPNSGSSDAKHFASYWAAYDVPRHLWHFNVSTFSIFAGKTGFIIKTIKKLPFDVFYISWMSERYKGSSASFIKGMVKALFFTVLSAIKSDRSSSIIYILRKADS